jgi:hypothetical protein
VQRFIQGQDKAIGTPCQDQKKHIVDRLLRQAGHGNGFSIQCFFMEKIVGFPCLSEPATQDLEGDPSPTLEDWLFLN